MGGFVYNAALQQLIYIMKPISIDPEKPLDVQIAGVPTDSAPPFLTKRGRLRSAAKLGPGKSFGIVWRRRAIWLPPLVAEAAFLLSAAYLAKAFTLVVSGSPVGTEWWCAILAALAGGTCRLISEKRELFMPRLVAVVGMGMLFCTATALVAGLLLPLDEFFAGVGQKQRLLASMPLFLFFPRVLFVIQAARFSPSLLEMDKRSRSDSIGLFESLRSKVEFWMR